MDEIANCSALFVVPKEPFKEPFKKWAKLHNESLIEEPNQRFNEKHVYLIE